MSKLIKKYKALLKKKNYLNKNCNYIKDFIVSPEINEYDLFKLALLNNIELEFGKGWNDLVLNLIQELDRRGWNRKVTCIKEKHGGLRFYTEQDFDEIIEFYTMKSEETCEVCGEKGTFKDDPSIIYVACDIHGRATKQVI